MIKHMNSTNRCEEDEVAATSSMNIKKVGLANYPKHLLANGGSSPNGRYPVQKPRQTPLTLAVFPIFGSVVISLLGLWVFQVF